MLLTDQRWKAVHSSEASTENAENKRCPWRTDKANYKCKALDRFSQFIKFQVNVPDELIRVSLEQSRFQIKLCFNQPMAPLEIAFPSVYYTYIEIIISLIRETERKSVETEDDGASLKWSARDKDDVESGLKRLQVDSRVAMVMAVEYWSLTCISSANTGALTCSNRFANSILIFYSFYCFH